MKVHTWGNFMKILGYLTFITSDRCKELSKTFLVNWASRHCVD